MTDKIELHRAENETDEQLIERIDQACDHMERIYAGGHYPRLTVERSWSRHNPVICGEMARPSTYRWYLTRELLRLANRGATVRIEPSRTLITLDDPILFERLDEAHWDITQKKLFLFAPERIELSIDRLEHYTGTRARDFQRYILLTNYAMHMKAFEQRYPDCLRPERSVQMPAYHHCLGDNQGVSIVNIGVGPSNAKNCTDHLAVLRPDAMVMVGHCGGIRNHQEIGDFVLASGYMRADHVLDRALPHNVPVAPSALLNSYLEESLRERELDYRSGTVYTTADRNWEFTLESTLIELKQSRSLAIDMESATVAANGFRYRIPNATILCVSDKPLHGSPKLAAGAERFYRETQKQHVDIAIRALELAKADWPKGLPNKGLRSADEPLMGGAAD